MALDPLGYYNEAGDYTVTLDGNKYIINVASLETTDLKVVAINSYHELNKDSMAIRNNTIGFALLGTMCAVLSLLVFVQNFFKPLFHIIHSMKQVQDGDLSVQVEVRNQDEIGYLAKSFNKMIRRINRILDSNTKLVKEVYESKYLQKEAQYNNLCAQIKPHFLYNTLNTISLLIKCKDSEGAVQSIEKLSHFLRGIMNADKNITLSSELEIVDSYLGILKARYSDNLSYVIDVAPEFKNYRIPALTLQPLVENAIIHGCEIKRGKSEIHIYSSQEEDKLYLHIVDNGIGIEKEKLAQLNRELSQETSLDEDIEENTKTTENIGLINVNKRIKLKYGDSYGILLSNNLSVGTHVKLKLPLPSQKGSD
ncbi:MAG: histidine kinase [Clostridiales bacterium]|nr:histidine kinase [Clostridiales bacterium]